VGDAGFCPGTGSGWVSALRGKAWKFTVETAIVETVKRIDRNLDGRLVFKIVS
jgi:hypothetical protein